MRPNDVSSRDSLAPEVKQVTQPRRQIRQLEVKVVKATRETPDTTTLVFSTGKDLLEYLPGHFLTIDPHQFRAFERFTDYLEDQKGRKEPPRAYSMSSAPHEGRLAITVKEERYVRGRTKYPPLLSPFLVHRTGAGVKLVITGFTGPYTLPPEVESTTDHLVHLCAGSGIVPNFSIIKHCLHKHPKLRHTLVYSNRTWQDVMFSKQLAKLRKQQPGRLRLVHTLTRSMEGAPDRARLGRVTVDLLRDAIPDPTECLVYACGPAVSKWDRQAARERGEEPSPRFLETTLAMLEEIGVPQNRIKNESYG